MSAPVVPVTMLGLPAGSIGTSSLTPPEAVTCRRERTLSMRELNSIRTASFPAGTCWSAVGMAETMMACAEAGQAIGPPSMSAITMPVISCKYFRMFQFPTNGPPRQPPTGAYLGSRGDDASASWLVDGCRGRDEVRQIGAL